MRQYLFGFGIFICFGLGVYVWKVLNTGLYVPHESLMDYSSIPSQKELVKVGDSLITSDDLEWEYKLMTSGLANDEELTAIPEFFNQEEQLKSLKDYLISTMIERKLLYSFVEQDPDFQLTDPARYSKCVGEWQETVGQNSEFFLSSQDKERLKSRLCEKDVVLQYLNEKLYAGIQVTEQEIARYYQENKSKFNIPTRVLVRQVVLASEDEAKKVRHRIRSYNFERYARELSITPESSNGGLVGPFAKGEMPRIFDVAFSMRQGEIRGILKSTYGFHIIKLEKKYPKSKLSLSYASKQIEAELRLKKQEEEYQKWVELALSAVPVVSPRPL